MNWRWITTINDMITIDASWLMPWMAAIMTTNCCQATIINNESATIMWTLSLLSGIGWCYSRNSCYQDACAFSCSSPWKCQSLALRGDFKLARAGPAPLRNCEPTEPNFRQKARPPSPLGSSGNWSPTIESADSAEKQVSLMRSGSCL